MKRSHRVRALVGALLLAVSGAAPAATPDLSGYWDLAVDGRKVPPARVLPKVNAAVMAEHARSDAHAVRWCNMLGLPYFMDAGQPINIRQGKREIYMYTPAQVAPRHIYFDRKEHINPDEFDPATGGDSIGSWEGDTLVVDTVGFSGNRGITTIPGGGIRTGKSHLVERFRLLENGTVLSVVSTWTDPTVFKAPHSYEYRYYRLADTYEPPIKTNCDPFNETRAKFLESPNE